MSPGAEKRLLQGVMAVTLLLPLTAAIAGVTGGPRFLGHPPVVPTDLDSHFRYISGLFLGMLLLFASCIPGIERKGSRLRLLAFLVVIGGAFRLLSLGLVGMPSLGHRIGLGIELIEVPLIVLWQMRVARRFAATAT
ncbi:DUF4345 domain-containing protein [Sphingomonas sp. HF-S4]|uniref:DUF4345 domain-containing protein n=1 Tax=Sphingomonas agrestis TaxID=3080540 RepID=A0ABU3YA59_9SPHN|nr:DUF4345 domain-containing protein [Sphingomonas sp. HF-S4]MDV3458301.1 DUF4345 domain-containing protein [Sphingomonas sp. HF-S4]